MAGPAERVQARLGHDCNCNRPSVETVTAAGFKITNLERDVLCKAPPIVRPLVVGVAQTKRSPGLAHESPGRLLTLARTNAVIHRCSTHDSMHCAMVFRELPPSSAALALVKERR